MVLTSDCHSKLGHLGKISLACKRKPRSQTHLYFFQQFYSEAFQSLR